MAMPVFRPGAPHDTVESRRNNLVGLRAGRVPNRRPDRSDPQGGRCPGGARSLFLRFDAVRRSAADLFSSVAQPEERDRSAAASGCGGVAALLRTHHRGRPSMDRGCLAHSGWSGNAQPFRLLGRARWRPCSSPRWSPPISGRSAATRSASRPRTGGSTSRTRSFGTAVANMSQGLLMFNSSGRLMMHNHRYAKMYGLPPDVMKPGCSLRDLLKRRQEIGALPGEDSRPLFRKCLGDDQAGKIVRAADPVCPMAAPSSSSIIRSQAAAGSRPMKTLPSGFRPRPRFRTWRGMTP